MNRPAGLLTRLKLIVAPETSIIAIVAQPAHRKLVVFAIVYAAYWLVLLLFLNAGNAIPLRLFGVFVPILAVLLWGGIVGLGIYTATLPLLYALVTMRGAEFAGGPSGPIYATLALLLVGGLRHYIVQLSRARHEVDTLAGLLPICASCKRIRDDRGYWQQLEQYLTRHAPVRFTHGICPSCHRSAMAEIP